MDKSCNIGKNNGFYGKHHTKETRKKMRENHIDFSGEKHPNFKDGRTLKKYYCIDCGKKLSGYRAKRCSSCSMKNKIKLGIVNSKGNNNAQWKNGITPIHIMIRNTFEYKKWKRQVFKRDNFECQECSLKKDIEAHHIKEFAKLLQEFLQEYDQFSPIEDKETLIRLAMKWKPFWDIDNGKTLCEDCHKLTYTGRPKKI